MKNNVYLMGFMGCGKTKVGQILAEQLRWKYLDTDDCIVKNAGLSIPDIFRKQGEAHFRKLEKECIVHASILKKHVIALGGGAIIDPENWKLISESGTTITLSYPPEILASRLKNKSDRPLLVLAKGKSLLDIITSLLDKRKEYYQRADLILHLNHEVQASLVAETLTVYLKGVLCTK